MALPNAGSKVIDDDIMSASQVMLTTSAASLVVKDDHSVPVGSKPLDLGALSRQIATFDVHSQLRFSGASVFISGLNLLGLEVAKNVCLSGPKSITIHDDRPATVSNAALVPMQPKMNWLICYKMIIYEIEALHYLSPDLECISSYIGGLSSGKLLL